ERQNRLGELLRDRELIVDFVVSETMHRAAEQSLSTFDLSNRLRVLIRQPGEYRNLRMGHSVRNEDLLPFRIVCDWMRIPDSQRRLILRPAADDSQRRHIAGGVQRIYRRGMIHEVGGPDFIVLEI